MPTRALEKYTRVKQIDNRVIKITTTRLERCPLIRKTKKRIINNFFQMTSDVRDIRCFLSDLSLIDRLIELASNLVPFKGLLSLFIYFVALRKCFYLNCCNDHLGLNMPGACSSSLRCRMVCITCSTTPSHHSLSIIYIHYLQV